MTTYTENEPGEDTIKFEQKLSPDDSPDLTGIIEGSSPTEDYDCPPEHQKLADNFRKYLAAAQTAKGNASIRWARNKCFLEGDQLLIKQTSFNGHILGSGASASTKYYRLTNEQLQRRKYSVDNTLSDSAKIAVGKKISMRPKAVVNPFNDSVDALNEATIYDAFLKYCDKAYAMDAVWAKMKFHETYTGNSFIYLDWDTLGGRAAAKCFECGFNSYLVEMAGKPCPNCSAMGQVVGEEDPELAKGMDKPVELAEVYEGASVPKFYGAQSIFIDPIAGEMKDAKWAIIECRSHVSDLRRMCPIMAKYIRGNDLVDAGEFGVSLYNSDSGQVMDTVSEDYVRWYIWLQMPTETYPNGFMMWVWNDKPIYFNDQVLYRYFGRLPIFHNVWSLKFPENIWAQSFVDEAAAQQIQLNETDTIIREYMEQVAKFRMMNPAGAISANELRDKTMDVINYDPSKGIPQMQNPPSMPQELWQRSSYLTQRIQTKAAVTPADTGKSNSGREMALYQAHQEQIEKGLNTYNTEEIKQFYKCLLIQETSFRDENWKFSVAGDMGVEVYSLPPRLFQGDISIENDDGLPTNPVQRRQLVMEQMAQGWYMDPSTGAPNIKLAAKMAGIKIPSDDLDVTGIQRSAALAFIRDAEMGNYKDLSEQDDIDVFNKVLYWWLNTKGRRPECDPELLDFLKQVWMTTLQMIQERQMAAMQGPQLTAGGGKPGETPKAGSPTSMQNAGASVTGDPETQAAQSIGAADGVGEAMAMGGAKHEG